MIRTSFNDDWQTRRKVNPFAELSGPVAPFQAVTLPHDAMIDQDRVAPDGEVTMEGGAGAYFSGGVFEYRKTFFVPEELRGQRVQFEFEGVYRDATVHINGVYAGQRPYGYSHFHIDADPYLRHGQDNEIRVEARAHQDARWYTGAGIYRPVWMLTGDVVRVVPDGIRVTTLDIEDGRATVEVATHLRNDSLAPRTLDLAVNLRDASGNAVTGDITKVTVLPGEDAVVRSRLYIREASLWDVDHPHLYGCHVALSSEGEPVDSDNVTFGIRSLRLDPDQGLRLNGRTVKLRGACVHHDNGPLGAATYARAEERRVRLLKDAGFNALRMSHQPMSKAMLDACDRLGMLVVDETFDVWTSAKSGFDYSLHFPEWWERDVEAMVAKDYNHPSVIMYSIGNEIPEAGSPFGAAWGRKLAEKVRSLDSTRYVTNAVNGFLAVMSDLAALRQGQQEQGGGVNSQMADAGDMINYVSASDLVTQRTAESFSVLDIAGMNYAEARYALDRELFPNRIILGTETFPTRIDGNWKLVEQHSHVIGDFTWTGWDYIGEVGIGRPQFATPDNPRPEHTAPFPHLLAGSGDIDITGHRRPASYYREIVFGLRSAPYIAVRRPENHGLTPIGGPWAWSDSLASWTWPGFEGKPITVEVYSDADEVELIGNGNSFGRRPVGAEHRFRTEFDIVYVPGELVAVAYRNGVETGRTSLQWANGPVRLTAESDRPVVQATGGDLAYVTLALTDAAGTLHTAADRQVEVEVTGAGELIGFGSAAPASHERFDATERHTHEGRALAVVRPTGTGKIRVLATAPDCEPVEAVITVE
ncbi:glycoside hydrolase family 2 protein [Streptomyces sp. S3(2020)]|uniref:glycoside hydrolase family 2 TIM barrel-domain containing protein n=1 Tax=Streptomyces sp. S3(2020) TaxID=2732044 RepID=UPI0014898351|nr:glycoside hydrolase family 2 TIM barrel-domain containing protein [Streptomyces sp. S3(2020)]NNN29415.1 glycoside hydrolase family 2 protein [Streptomyces sp. S3(2020)]